MELISNLEHEDCFDLNSPFGYLINKKAKIYLLIYIIDQEDFHLYM